MKEDLITEICRASINNPTELVDALATEHSTYQQAFTSLCVQWLEYLATVKHYDMRNIDSVRLAKQFVAKIDQKDRILPRI